MSKAWFITCCSTGFGRTIAQHLVSFGALTTTSWFERTSVVRKQDVPKRRWTVRYFC
jgi:hypothetical protein